MNSLRQDFFSDGYGFATRALHRLLRIAGEGSVFILQIIITFVEIVNVHSIATGNIIAERATVNTIICIWNLFVDSSSNPTLCY